MIQDTGKPDTQKCGGRTWWLDAVVIGGARGAGLSVFRGGHALWADRRALLAALIAHQDERTLLFTLCMKRTAFETCAFIHN